MTDTLARYSFCRAADDLIDDAPNSKAAQHSLTNLNRFLDLAYNSVQPSHTAVVDFVKATFSPEAHAALLLLPTPYLSSQPLHELLHGFEIDLGFADSKTFPISGTGFLIDYGAYVAGTVARLCIELVYHHTQATSTKEERQATMDAGGLMGIALQLVNIARDIQTDAKMGRCYIPTSWLLEQGLSPADIIKDPSRKEAEWYRQRILDQATQLYLEAKPAIEKLPPEARGPMRVAVESYMEIGRVLRTPGYRVKRGRATVPKWRRIRVAWRALTER